MSFNSFVTKVTGPVSAGLSKAKFKVTKYSPEICLVTAGVTGVATVVTACRATLKADDILNQLEENKEKIAAATAAVESGETDIEYTEKDKNRDMAIAYKNAAIGFVKLYAPTIALGALTAGLVFCSYRTMKLRHLGLVAAYTALDDGFKKYRARAVEKFGEDVDRELATGVTKKKVMVKEADPETGEVKTEKKEVSTIDDILLEDPSNYDRVFARGLADACQTYDPYTNESFLLGQQTHWTHMLQTRGFVFLSEVYKALGFPVTQASRQVGWILDPADPNKRDKKVSFGVIEKVYLKDGDYVHPTGKIEASYIDSGYYLTFNIDGLIWNLTPEPVI